MVVTIGLATVFVINSSRLRWEIASSGKKILLDFQVLIRFKREIPKEDTEL